MNFKSKKWLSLFIIGLLIFSMPMSVSQMNTVYAADTEYEAYFQSEGDFSFNLYVRPKGSTVLGTIVYCFNHSKTPPYLDDEAPSYNGSVAYTKVTGFSDTLKGKMSTPRIQDEDELEKKLLAIIANGYPMNESGFQGTLSDGSFRKVTQIAIWYFTDSKELNSNQLANPYTSVPLSVEEQAVAEKLIASTYDGASNMKLDFYIADNSKYQNLLAANITPVTIEKINMVFSKQNLDGVQLAGAEIELRNADDTETVTEWISDGTEKNILLDPGTYIFREKNAPAGYLKVSDITFKVDRHGKVTIVNQNATDTVTVEQTKLIVVDQAEPADPTPVDPVDPNLVDPVDPTPVDSVDPTPVDPVDPTPVDPVDPAPVDPVDPAPVDPVDPNLVDPVDLASVEPVDPTPVDPVDPAPVDPVDPTPVEPVNPIPGGPGDPTPGEPVNPIPGGPGDSTSVEPVVPTSVEPVNPTPVEPVVPTPVEPVNPTPVEPVVPTSVEPVVPTLVEPVVPTSDEPVVPTSDEPVVPASDEPVVPTSDVQVVKGGHELSIVDSVMTERKELPQTGYAANRYSLLGMLLISLAIVFAYFVNRKTDIA